ncbi:hypothetical protein [Streptomyces sp. CH-036]|uniref:hypothetical protein n=1 Tax=Streptomyces sp. CH-036 TaxID=3406733 RepID=UPI003C74A686
MQEYRFTADGLVDTLTPGEATNASGSLKASSPEAAKKKSERDVRSRGYEPTGRITVTSK